MTTHAEYINRRGNHSINIVSDIKEPPKEGLQMSVTAKVTWGETTNVSNAVIRVSPEDLIGLRAVIDSVIESYRKEGIL